MFPSSDVGLQWRGFLTLNMRVFNQKLSGVPLTVLVAIFPRVIFAGTLYRYWLPAGPSFSSETRVGLNIKTHT